MTERKKPAKKAARKAPAKAAAPEARKTRRAATAPSGPLASGPATGIHDLRPSSGATRGRKRVGRGPGSGHGKTAGRGHKGQKSRTGYSHMRGFEGGQMPLHRRVPKRGFTNVFRVEYSPVNLSALSAFAKGDEVTPDSLHERGITARRARIKILGDGQIKAALVVRAHKFSASARAKIEQAGGRCEVIETPKPRAKR